MSRSLICRVAPFLAARIRDNHRLLSSTSVSALNDAFPSSSSSSSSDSSASVSSSSQSESLSTDAVHLSESCVQRMKELQASESGEKMLRLGVETGGCSGFQYVFELDSKTNSDDRVFERDGVKLVIDNVSYDFVKGATVDYVEELIRSAFVVKSSFFQSFIASIYISYEHFYKAGMKLVRHLAFRRSFHKLCDDLKDNLMTEIHIQVAENPSAVGGCSCKSSFMVKQ